MTDRFRRLLTVTTAMTFGLILLGVYTGAIGAGLTCGARWPLCDGWMGLFPANWASFVEWFHRLVAMITGFAILGSTLAAWRGDYTSRIKYATGVATVVLPVQILLGANTIINFGATAQVLHHAAALTILTAMVAATAWTFDTTDSPTETTSASESTAETDASPSSD
ncbi:cytochrome AA3 biosynthesis protein [Halomicroarcula sp. F13]|uniref:Cytochrome AA3 biosynthesis protein n=1 Tax=Haloarcula rubra TaxID=2487747 RepID=A0AAW4PQZ8_9EURY|nr:cytochrome AA3 biosynthesis protein [Halomicroarcula rubra]MBX0324023.1 cytochrome AA3 biosynthesis protein [Halomicroarcula rubra]